MDEQATVPSGEPPRQDVDDLIFHGEADHPVSQR